VGEWMVRGVADAEADADGGRGGGCGR